MKNTKINDPDSRPKSVSFSYILLLLMGFPILVLLLAMFLTNPSKMINNPHFIENCIFLASSILFIILGFGILKRQAWARILSILTFAGLIYVVTAICLDDFKTINNSKNINDFLASAQITGVAVAFLIFGRALFGLALHPEARKYFNLHDSNERTYSNLHTISGTLVISAIPIVFSIQSIARNNYIPLWVYILMNLYTYLAYSVDKDIAKRNKLDPQQQERRTPEKELHFCEFWGGFPAAYLAQRIVRHKIKKAEYQSSFFLIVFIHSILVLSNMMFSGFLLQSFVVTGIIFKVLSR